MTKPIIGVTCNFTPGVRKENDTFNLYTPYVSAIQKSGGIAQLIPISPPEDIPQLVELYDGLLLSGGGGLHPHIAKMKSLPGLRKQNPIRYQFEALLISAALERKIPILGVCRGHQMINEVLGGTIQNLEGKEHLQSSSGNQPHHEMSIVHHSLLFECCQAEVQKVNSFHRQVVSKVGKGLQATAYSSDGFIECIEGEGETFLLGVQFHPEYMLDMDEGMANIYRKFVSEAAKKNRVSGYNQI